MPDRDPAREAVESLRFAPPDRVGVAVSGGPDSVAALLLVARACAASSVPVVALHVDHGLRARAAAEDQAVVERVARQLGVGFEVRKIDVAGTRAREGGSTEFVARTLRHDALDRMAAQLRLTHVVFAHHREDQVETVLLSLLRGAWPGALAGIPRERRMPGGALVVRPFLAVPKDVLRAHAADLGPALDLMNLDEAYRRVAVRQRLLPALHACAEDVDGLILGIARAAGRIDASAIARAGRISHSPGVHVEPGVALAPAGVLAEAGRFARSRYLRSLCDGDPSFGHATWPLFESFERAVAVDYSWSVDVRRGVRLTARDGVVALFAISPSRPEGARVVFESAPVGIPADPVRTVRVDLPSPGMASPAGEPGAAHVWVPKGATIEVRPRRPRDRFRLGPQGTKLLADELSDRKIQPAWRPRIPLVFIDGALRWIPGIRVVRAENEPPPNVRLTLEGGTPWADYRVATT